MAKELSLSFTLQGGLGASFKSAFIGAQGQVQALSRAIRDMERTPTGKIGASFQKQKEKIRDLGASVKEAQATLAGLQAKARAAGGANTILARQIELAQQKVDKLTSSFQRQVSSYRDTIAQARTASGSIQKLAGDYRTLSAAMDRASQKRANIMGAERNLAANRQQLSDQKNGLMTTVATGMSVAFPAKLAIDFEQQMAKVGAVSRASAEDMVTLTAKAREMGRDTQFSAIEAGQGMEFLAMAGFTTKQTVDAIPGTLNLAAAAGSDLGLTCDIASNMLTGFGLAAKDMDHVGDVLVATFTSSNSTLETLGETMKYVAPVSKNLGISFEDTAAMAGLLHNAGIQASMAGTALRSIELRLAAPPSEAKKALESLNISTKDAAGNMRPMLDIIEELMTKTKGLGNAAKADIFKDIAGTEAVSALMVLGDQAFKTTDEYGNAITNMAGKQCTAMEAYLEKIRNVDGACKTTADRMTATTKGALTRLGSAWSDIGITIGNFFLPAINAAASLLTSVAGIIASFTEKFPGISRGLALAAGGFITLSVVGKLASIAFLVMKGGLLSVQKGLLLASGGMLSFGTTTTVATTTATAGMSAAGTAASVMGKRIRMALIGTGIGALVAGLGFAAELIYEHWDGISSFFSTTFSSIGTAASDLYDFVVNPISDAGTWIVTFFGSVGPEIYSRIAPHLASLRNAFGGVADWIAEKWNALSSFFSGLWIGILNVASSVSNAIASVWDSTGSFITNTLNELANTASSVWDWISNAASTAANWLSQIWYNTAFFLSSIWQGISDAASFAWDWIAASCAPVVEWLTVTWQTVSGVLMGVWDGVVEAASFCWSGITEVFAPAVEWFGGIADGIRSVFDALFGWLQKMFDWVLNTAANIKSFVAGIFGGVEAAADKANTAVGNKQDVREGQKVMSSDGRHRSGRKSVVGTAPLPTPPTPKTAGSLPNRPQLAPPPKASGGSGGGKRSSGGGGGGGGRSRSGGGGGGSASGASTKAKDSGPTTIVRLAGDNQHFTTEFIPAGASTGTAKRLSGGAAAASATPASTLARGSQTASNSTSSKAQAAPTISRGASGKQVAPTRVEGTTTTEKPVPVYVTNFADLKAAKRQDSRAGAGRSKAKEQRVAPQIAAPMPSMPVAAPPAPIADNRPAISATMQPQGLQPRPTTPTRQEASTGAAPQAIPPAPVLVPQMPFVAPPAPTTAPTLATPTAPSIVQYNMPESGMRSDTRQTANPAVPAPMPQMPFVAPPAPIFSPTIAVPAPTYSAQPSDKKTTSAPQFVPVAPTRQNADTGTGPIPPAPVSAPEMPLIAFPPAPSVAQKAPQAKGTTKKSTQKAQPKKRRQQKQKSQKAQRKKEQKPAFLSRVFNSAKKSEAAKPLLAAAKQTGNALSQVKDGALKTAKTTGKTLGAMFSGFMSDKTKKMLGLDTNKPEENTSKGKKEKEPVVTVNTKAAPTLASKPKETQKTTQISKQPKNIYQSGQEKQKERLSSQLNLTSADIDKMTAAFSSAAPKFDFSAKDILASKTNTGPKGLLSEIEMTKGVSQLAKSTPTIQPKEISELLPSTRIEPTRYPKERKSAPSETKIEVNMSNDIDASNASANAKEVRRRMDNIRPEIERLVRRSLADLQSQNRRLAHVQ